MIENEREYQVSKRWIAEFEKTLESLRTTPRPEKLHPRLHRAMMGSVESPLEDLRQEVVEYEAWTCTKP